MFVIWCECLLWESDVFDCFPHTMKIFYPKVSTFFGIFWYPFLRYFFFVFIVSTSLHATYALVFAWPIRWVHVVDVIINGEKFLYTWHFDRSTIPSLRQEWWLECHFSLWWVITSQTLACFKILPARSTRLISFETHIWKSRNRREPLVTNLLQFNCRFGRF